MGASLTGSCGRRSSEITDGAWYRGVEAHNSSIWPHLVESLGDSEWFPLNLRLARCVLERMGEPFDEPFAQGRMHRDPECLALRAIQSRVFECRLE
jgi:hypothetical protein